MAKKFNLTELLNERSRMATETEETEEQTLISEGKQTTVDIDELVPSKENFYSTKVVQDLKESIEIFGVLQPLLVTEREHGKREILAGHRRHAAVLELIKEGKEQFRYIPVIVKPRKNEILDKLLLIMANRFREKTDWEKMTETIETERLVGELKKQMEIPGKTRDLLAEVIKTSATQIERYKKVYNNLIPELMAEFKENRINISVAYEVSRLPEEYQEQAAELFRENEVLTLPDVKNLRKTEEESKQIAEKMEYSEPVASEAAGAAVAEEPAQEEEFEPAPETVTSLCYSCIHYEKCHEKKSTVTQCKDYINRAEAYKTDEQRYNEEQDKIDRETQKKLKERAQEEMMQQLPSEKEMRQREITLPTSKYEDICSGVLSFLLLKKDGYKVGDELELSECANGRETGRKVNIKIIYVWQDWTGLEDDYCIIGFSAAVVNRRQNK